MNKKDLFLNLVNAESEDEVKEIVSCNPVLSKDENWLPYGGFRGNFSHILNQQDNPVASLVEKPINSIDALLIKECRLKGINPEESSAPNSIKEAVELFYGIKNADFSEATETERRQIAENIQIIAEGSKKNPNIIIYDNGEGQHPDDFRDTFVSLNKDNKIKIKFVQGKYNMGSTGALPYCGNNKYQLIMSRKDSRLLNGRKDLFGFTLVRLHGDEEGYKETWYEYCVDTNKEVFSFEADELDLGLYNRKFSFGTYIKLFNYDLPRPSDIKLDLWRDLNRYLYSPALPILLYEKREFKSKSLTKLMLGNKMRIMIDERDMKESTFTMELSFQGVNYPCMVTIFKDHVDKSEFIDKLAVVFTINGQVHHHLTNSFIITNAKLSYLSGSLLVNIDGTDFPANVRRELFMASRDRMRDCNLYRQLVQELARELRDNDILRQLNEKRRDERIFKNPKDKKFLENIMGNLIKKNKEIIKLLGLNGQIATQIKKSFGKKGKEKETSFKPKRFPTFIRFKKIAPGNIKMMPQNGECLLNIETDVEDEYLIRSRDAGELKIKITNPFGGGYGGKETPSESSIFDVNRVGPNQGEIKLRIKACEDLPIGTEVPVNIELTSPEGPHSLTAFIKISNPVEKGKKEKKENEEVYSLPELIEVYRERKQGYEIPIKLWSDDEYKWDGIDIAKVFPSSEENLLVDAVAVNMDADVVHDYIRGKKLADKNIENVKRLYKVGIYLLSLIIYFQIRQREEIEEKEELLSHLMKGIGKIIIQLVINEEIIKEIEKE